MQRIGHIIMALFLAFSLPAKADDGLVCSDSLRFKIFFPASKYEWNASYMGNSATLDAFADSIVRSGRKVSEVILTGNASPEGKTTTNDFLSKQRAQTAQKVLCSLYPDIFNGVKFTVKTNGEGWNELLDYLNSANDKYSGKAARVINNTPEYIFEKGKIVSGRKKILSELDGGKFWMSAFKKHFPQLRSTLVIIVLGETIQKTETTSSQKPSPAAGTALMKESKTEATVQTAAAIAPSPSCQFSIGTNLLYDAATIANLYVQFGFARHWAVKMWGSFSPWSIRTDFKLKTLLLQPELKYYFSEGFKGHYIGISGQYGWYNIALPCSKVRYQDRNGNSPLYGGSLVYGYTVAFSRHWGMDFNISAGYVHLDYDCFYNIENGARFTTGTREWFGPTGLGVSIYYAF